MLFNNACFESYKERNLYYKIFAGYMFNSKISGWQERLAQFVHVLSFPVYTNLEVRPIIAFNPMTTHVTFDNHIEQLELEGKKRGEFADILLFDNSMSFLVGIEAKYLTDWNFAKDIVENLDRLTRFAALFKPISTVLVLLVTESKWKRVQNQFRRKDSQYRRLLSHKREDIRVITWEQIAEICEDIEVRNYLKERLKLCPKSSKNRRSITSH